MTARVDMEHPSRRWALVQPVEAFVAALASSSPAPGGGAAGALCGALAAALVAMVSRVTAERDPSTKAEMGPISASADELCQRLQKLVDEDMEAYRGWLQARKAPTGSLDGALKRAIDVPRQLARDSRDVLALCVAAAPRARPSTLSDLGVAAALAGSALEAGALTARANLAEVKDADFARMAANELQHLLDEGHATRQRASEMVARRIEAGG